LSTPNISPPEPGARPSPRPRSRTEAASLLLAAAAVLFVLHQGLAVALLTGLLAHLLLHEADRLLHTERLSRGASRALAGGVLGLLAAAAVGALVLLLIGFVRGRIGDLPALFEKVADSVAHVRSQLESWGLRLPVLEDLVDAERLQDAVVSWLRAHSVLLSHAGGEAGRFVVHTLIGGALGFLVFFGHPQAPEGRPLALALEERVRRLAGAFRAVVLAQIEISAVNTSLTAAYIVLVLPLWGSSLPLKGTLVAVTFAAGLLPVVGNLISGTLIVLVSFGVSLGTAVASLVFLIAIHKLEYFLNARIVGTRVGAAAWEMLLAMVVLEAGFGLAGVALAPILYAYLKRELVESGLV